MTKSGHARKDLVSRLRPDEGRRARVGQLDISPDGGFQLARAAMDAPAQLLRRQRGEPALHQIDPRTTRRREVDMEARVPGRPAVNAGRLVGAGVVDDQVDVK